MCPFCRKSIVLAKDRGCAVVVYWHIDPPRSKSQSVTNLFLKAGLALEWQCHEPQGGGHKRAVRGWRLARCSTHTHTEQRCQRVEWTTEVNTKVHSNKCITLIRPWMRIFQVDLGLSQPITWVIGRTIRPTGNSRYSGIALHWITADNLGKE